MTSGSVPDGLASALDAMREGFQIIGFDWRYRYVNEAAAQHGRATKESLLGRRFQDCYPGIENTELFGLLRRCMTERTAARLDNEFSYRDGSKEWFELRIDPVPEGVRVLSIDIGRRRRLEAQLAHAQKMEALGQLAGGIAHDFNNLLTIILSYGQLIEAKLGSETPVRNYLQEINVAAERGAELTAQLLALGRRQVIEPRVLAVNAAISALMPMLCRLVGDLIEVELKLAPETGNIRVDSGQLDQVLLNLAANARDAMPHGGRLMLSSENIEFDEGCAELHPELTPGSYVKITVSDTGSGMGAEILGRIFEPFFTTKGPERGSGLGLATSHGIVRQSGGHIWVYSELGQGTTFKLLFPRVFEERESVSRKLSAPPRALEGRETVMVVEDEPSLRALCRVTLERYGYTMLEARDAREALALSERHQGEIHALLIDVMLPSVHGPELVTRLVAGRPRARVLYMSGFTDHALLEFIPRDQYLEKPFTPDMLVRRLRQLLDRPSAPSPEGNR